MFQKRTLGVVFSLIMSLAGCGQKGALYLPSEEPQSKKAAKKEKIEKKNEHKAAPIEESELSEQDAVMP